MDTSTAITGDGAGKRNGRRRSLVRKRPVSFGISRNYHGNVYTIQSDDSNSDDEIGDDDFSLQSSSTVNRRTLAMIGVPPEHVPEGILNLIRSYRPFVEHVRVVIADDSDDEDDGGDEKEEIDNNKSNFGLDDDTTVKQRRDRTYLILVQLFREEDAAMFVEDLDGQPYIAFDDRDTCRIERVVSVETTATVPGTKNSTPLLSGQPNERSQQNDGKSSNNHPYHQSLPLLHPNFGTPMTNSTTEGEYPQEEKKGEQKSGSRCLNAPTNREDSKINCAVCLEDLGLEDKKLDDRNVLLAATEGATSAFCTPVTTSHPSLLTTVCNHTFHLDCLQQCTGPCPVCRYDHSGLNETLSQCHVCGTTEHNYVCLICGVVSCGVPHTAEAVPPVAAAATASSTTALTTTATPRFYTSSHAGQHYRDTLHAYALDTETQHVYDFCGQGYVHRLVQNKEDGKLVEVNDPRQSSAVARGRTPGERSLTPGLSDAQEGEVVHRKLEGAAEQYNSLLKSQLEQQRAYYEERLNDVRREFSAEHQRTKAQDLLSVLRQERKQVTQRFSTLQRRKAKVAETMAFLANMNESLESNKIALKHRIQQAVREQNDSKEMVLGYLPELEAKLSDLMKQLMD
jgi:BRCA1-associated protein